MTRQEIFDSVDNMHDVTHVLICFEQMGASASELEAERNRLLSDRSYCDDWCRATGFEPPRQYRRLS